MRTAIRPAALVTCCVAVLLAALPSGALAARPLTAVGAPAPRAAAVTPRSDAWERKVLQLTNQRRRAHGVRPLRASSCADGFAERWTRHLARARVLKHQDLGPMLRCPNTSWAGENIAYGFETPRALVSAWMHSPGHRANILSRHFHRLGVSGWRATNGVTYATQDFIG